MNDRRDLAFQERSLQSPDEFRARRNEEIQLFRGPSVELANISEQASVDYARSVIQTGLLLNGEAVVALPAIAGLIKDDLDPILSLLLFGGCLFVIGLAFSWLAAIIAYFAICNRNAYYTHDAIRKTEHVEADFAKKEQIRECHINIVHEIEGKLRKMSQRYNMLRWCGVVLCSLSFVSFASGASLTGSALLSKSKREPRSYQLDREYDSIISNPE